MNSIKSLHKMDTIFMNSENSEISDPYKLLLNLPDKINFKKGDKYVALSNVSMHYTWKKIKKSYKNNRFKISAAALNDKFELSDRSYFVSDTQYLQ